MIKFIIKIFMVVVLIMWSLSLINTPSTLNVLFGLICLGIVCVYVATSVCKKASKTINNLMKEEEKKADENSKID